MKKLGRNAPCHCGSGKKYKKCHMKSDQGAANAKFSAEIEDDLIQLDDHDEALDPSLFDWTPSASLASEEETEAEAVDQAHIDAFNTLYEQITSAKYETKWDLIETAFEEQPSVLCDDEMVFYSFSLCGARRHVASWRSRWGRSG